MEQSQLLSKARIGTVHSVCQSYLEEFCFEAGLSPRLNVVDEAQSKLLLTQSLASAIDESLFNKLEVLAHRFALESWSDHVSELVNMARTNGLAPEDLINSLQSSKDRWEEILPEKGNSIPSKELLGVLESTVNSLRMAESFDKTRDYGEQIDRLRNGIMHNSFAWKDWLSLAKSKPAKQALEFIEELKEKLLNIDRLPEFQDDLFAYLGAVYEASRLVWKKYQARKSELGVVDYSDQERLFLDLLENPVVCARLEERLDLFMVDEFQDTNPIQLAIFSKLQGFARQTVYVGDAKQAIYSFRGSDPQLVHSFTNYQLQQGATVSDLRTSYRSVPDLVHLANSLFEPVFQGQEGAEYQTLSAHRSDRAQIPSFQVWNLTDKRWDKRLEALTDKVEELVMESIDPEIELSDIGILCYSKARVRAVSQAFAAKNIPYKAIRPGFMKTPEVCLVQSALRWLMNPKDQLAKMEILTLAFHHEAPDWIPDRIKEVQDREFKPEYHDFLNSLSELRQEMVSLSLQRLIKSIYQVLNLYEVVSAWQPIQSAQKQARFYLEHFLKLANDYEESALSFQTPSSIPGFLHWLDDLHKQKEDSFPFQEFGEGVSVLTWHKAKGLEWPIVIVLDLEQDIKDRCWDLNINMDEAFDPKEPLRNRQPTLLFRPFGRHGKNVSLYERAKRTEYGITQCKLAREESSRLLYVTITRARDVLILANSKRFDSFYPDEETLWSLGGFARHNLGQSALRLPSGMDISACELEVSIEEKTPQIINWTPALWFKSIGNESPLIDPLFLTPSKQSSEVKASRGEVLVLPTKLELKSTENPMERGEIIHSLFAYYLNQSGTQDAPMKAPYRFDLNLWESFKSYCKIAFPFCFSKFNLLCSHTEVPIRFQNDQGQWYRGWIDWIIESESGVFIIDHKLSEREDIESEQFLKTYFAQLATYHQAMQVSGKKVLGTWLHLPLQGLMVEINCDFQIPNGSE